MSESRRVPLLVGLTVLTCCAYFFQGGGWNQNAHFLTTLALVEDGTLALDRYRASTGDLAHAADGSVVSAKALATSLSALPGYLLAKAATAAIDNRADQLILRAYLTTLATSGLALAGLGAVLYTVLRRRLRQSDAVLLALATCLATPLFPNSTMLTSHPLALLAAVGAYGLLEEPRLRGRTPGPSRLAAAGALAGLAAAHEYLQAVLLVPLGLYVLWQLRAAPRREARRGVAAFVAGVAGTAIVPLWHHLAVYGSPLATGYARLTDGRFAADAAHGFMGFDGLSLGRLYELTFGGIRGFFLLSPFLVAAIPGIVRLIRAKASRPEGLVTGSIVLGIFLLIASLVYWHSGSAVGSRYALAAVGFSAVPIAAVLPAHRRWVVLGMVAGFALMVLATSVTAIPPPPGRLPYENVVRWLWERFAAGNLASWQQAIVVDAAQPLPKPTLPYAFNLGQLAGLQGLASLVPFAALLAALAALWWRELRRRPPSVP